jgi:hypothetical protein
VFDTSLTSNVEHPLGWPAASAVGVTNDRRHTIGVPHGCSRGPPDSDTLRTSSNSHESAEALQCYAGTAPLTKKSGKSRFVHVRRACNKVLRATVHLWADQSRQKCAWADVYYQQKKAQGQRHAQALRCLGQRWLKIWWRMWQDRVCYDVGRPSLLPPQWWRLWQDRVCYDEALHMLSLAKSGSWVIGLMPPPKSAPTA